MSAAVLPELLGITADRWAEIVLAYFQRVVAWEADTELLRQ